MSLVPVQVRVPITHYDAIADPSKLKTYRYEVPVRQRTGTVHKYAAEVRSIKHRFRHRFANASTHFHFVPAAGNFASEEVRWWQQVGGRTIINAAAQ